MEIVLMILAVLGFIYWKHGPKKPVLNSLQSPSEAGTQGNTAKQDVFGGLGIPIADYANGTNFYIANQPWFFQQFQNGVMPSMTASRNITGAPSKQTLPEPRRK